MIFGTLSFRGCGGQPLALVWNIRVKSQMPISPEHAFKEKSTKSLIHLPLRTIYNRTFQCETPCSLYCMCIRPSGYHNALASWPWYSLEAILEYIQMHKMYFIEIWMHIKLVIYEIYVFFLLHCAVTLHKVQIFKEGYKDLKKCPSWLDGN